MHRRLELLNERADAEWRNLIRPWWDEFTSLCEKYGVQDLRAREGKLTADLAVLEERYQRSKNDWIAAWGELHKPYRPRTAKVGDTEILVGDSEAIRQEKLQGTLGESDANMEKVLTDWEAVATMLETLRYVIDYIVRGNPPTAWEAGESPFKKRQAEYIVSALEVVDTWATDGIEDPRFLTPLWKEIARRSLPSSRGTTVGWHTVRKAFQRAKLLDNATDLPTLKVRIRKAVDQIGGEARRRDATKAVKERVIHRLELLGNV